jgi:hypothetical protein
MVEGFRNFLMRGDVIVVAVGLVVALAFSTLVKGIHRFDDQSARGRRVRTGLGVET